jgi:hypothetical protein
VKLYAWPASARHEDARSDKPHTFYGQHAIVTDPQGYIRRDAVSTYRWLRKTIGIDHARYCVWRMVANPIARASCVEVRNDLRQVAS